MAGPAPAADPATASEPAAAAGAATPAEESESSSHALSQEQEPRPDPEHNSPSEAGTDAVAAEPYRDNEEYLDDELQRVDVLMRAATIRWLYVLAQHKPSSERGMLQVDHEEVAAYLGTTWVPPDEPPPQIAAEVEEIWREARKRRQAIHARLAATPQALRQSLRLPRLRRRFALSPFERDVLLVCLLPELDDRYRRLVGYLQDDAARAQPTVGQALNLLPPALYEQGDRATRRAAFSSRGALLQHRLLAVGGETRGDASLSMRSLRLDDRIQRYLLGNDRPDDRLQALRGHVPGDGRPLILDEAAAEALQGLQEWLAALPGPRAALFFHGPYGSSRRARAAHLCRALDMPLLVYDVRAAPQQQTEWQLLVDLAYREARLQGAALYWHGCEALLGGDGGREAALEQQWDDLFQALEAADTLTFLGSESAWEPAARLRQMPYAHLECPAPDYDTRRRLWAYYLSQAVAITGDAPPREALAAELANDFAFTAGQMEDALVSARSIAFSRESDPAKPDEAGARPALAVADIYEGCRRQSTRRVQGLVQRVRPRRDLRLEDVVLPPASRLQLQEVFWRDQNRSRLYGDLQFGRRLRLGKGLVVLFTGTSGTGKTLAAEALASERRVDLYQVDLSGVISKWVGETEKNINRVFAEVEGANAILFFDEADAMFGKRAEVKDAQDRWANMEVNYLLQRIESYSGTVILASNLRQNIDAAFLRRIHMTVDFPLPNERLRATIYRQTFPETVVPPPDDALQRLAAHFRFSGGSIKNTIVDAASRALANNRFDEAGRLLVTERDMVLAAVREYQKLGRPVTPDDFRGEYFTWATETLLNPPEAAPEVGAAGSRQPANGYGPQTARARSS